MADLYDWRVSATLGSKRYSDDKDIDLSISQCKIKGSVESSVGGRAFFGSEQRRGSKCKKKGNFAPSKGEGVRN